MKGRLLALSSAAVLAVYTAGYARTRSAAEMLDADERRPPMPRPGATDRTPIPATPAAPSVVPARPAANALNATAPAAAPERITDAASRASSTKTVPDAAVAANTHAQDPADHSDARATTTTRDGAPTPARASAAETPSVATPASTEGGIAAAPQAAAVTTLSSVALAETAVAAAAPAAPSVPILKDGRYTGWGTCRHGDLQATILIENGRISTASISQCLTRYPCDWIRPLPPQVVQRQSALVDYISGATESTNAFYYAILQAIGKAQQ